MEAFLFHPSSSPDQPFSPSKTTPIMKTQKKGAAAGNRGRQQRSSFNLPRVSDNFVAPLNLQNNITGLLPAPFTPYYINLYHSYPPFPMKQQQQQQQPPLLPLPIVSPTKTNTTSNIIQNPRIIKNLSCPPATTTNRKNKKNQTKNPATKEGSLKKLPMGSDPKDLPKALPKILTLSSGSDCTNYGFSFDAMRDDHHRVDEFSGSVAFTVSPPPSSLPLPTFSLRQKLSCNAEAAGVDAGATDNLCRLLRLR